MAFPERCIHSVEDTNTSEDTCVHYYQRVNSVFSGKGFPSRKTTPATEQNETERQDSEQKKNKTFSRQASLDSVTFPLPCVEHKTFGERKGFVCTTTTATSTRQSLASGDFVDPSKSTEQRVVVVVWQKVFVFGVGD